MLHILFGHKQDEISAVDTFFDNQYDLSWFESDLAKAMLKDICGYTGHDGHAITVKDIFNPEQTVTISMTGLASGMKALLIMLNTDTNFVSATRCGDNCIPWIVEIAKHKELYITINYYNDFSGEKIHVLNDDTEIQGYLEVNRKFSKYARAVYSEDLELLNEDKMGL